MESASIREKIMALLIILSMANIVGCGKVISTSTPIPTSTKIPMNRAIPTALIIPELTEIVPPTKTAEPTRTEYYEFFPSPDGARIIRTKDWETYEIIQNGKMEWTYIYDKTRFNIIDASYSPLHWSSDGKFLYLGIRHSMDGGIGVFYSGSGVSKLNLETGTITELIPEEHFGMFAFAISPDGKQIVYVNENESPVRLKSLDLSYNTEKTLLVLDGRYEQAGCIGWSPDFDKISFMTLEVLDEKSSNYSYGISVLDLKSLNSQSIVENFDRWLKFVSWGTSSEIKYLDWQETVWRLDLESRTLSTEGTATPIP